MCTIKTRSSILLTLEVAEIPTSSEATVPELTFTVEPYLSGVRVDSFLARHLRNYTSWRLHRMVTEGLVKVDQMPADATQRLFRDQVVTIQLVEPPDKLLQPDCVPLSIVYEDPWLLVIDKQVGIVAHPVGEFQDGTLSNAIQHHLDRHTTAKGLLRPGVVHRLDRMTSGLIVVTKEHLSHRILSIDFQEGRTQKSYLALVQGHPTFSKLVVDQPIGMHPKGNSVLMSSRPNARKPRPARTDVTTVERMLNCSLVECTLHTGRSHQIRVHMADIGHPVLGDEYYDINGTIKNAARLKGSEPTSDRHALHASRLGFQHPILSVWMEFRSKPPQDFWTLQLLATPASKNE